MKQVRFAPLPPLVACLLVVSAAGRAAQTAPAEPEREAVMLSPFTVSTDKDTGYAAQETLSGTRLRTSLRDVAAPMAIITPEFMQDLGVTSVDKALLYTPSIDTVEGDNGGPGRDAGGYLRSGNGQAFSIRGFVTNNGSQSAASDFFTSVVSNDIYNVERITLSRGPNALLFGVGGAEGVYVSSTKRAQLQRTKSQVQAQYDRWSSRRVALDHNQVVLPGTLALRLNTLHGQKREFRIFEGNRQNRLTGSVAWQPVRHTRLTLNHENYSISRNIVPLMWEFDRGILQWAAKGRPTVNFLPAGQLWTNTRSYFDASGRPIPVAAGVVDADGFVDSQTDFDPRRALVQNTGHQQKYIAGLGLANPFLNARYQTTLNSNTFGGVAGVQYQTMDPWALYGMDRRANLEGGTWDDPSDRIHGRWTHLFVEQRIFAGLFLEVAGNRAVNKRSAAIDRWSSLTMDVDRYLPDGTLNPGFLMPYAEGTTTLNESDRTTSEYRATLSYETDLAQIHRWLGRHSFAALGQTTRTDSGQDVMRYVNLATVGRTGWFNDAVSGGNAFSSRIYYPNGKVPYPLPNAFEITKNLPRLAGFNLTGSTPTDAAPVNLALRTTSRPTKTRFTDDALSLAWQARWFKDRVVTVLGYRKDKTASYDVPPMREYIDPAVPGAGTDPLQRFYSYSREVPLNPTPVVATDGIARTYGVVYHALSWAALTFNQSRNFTPVSNASWRNFEGRPAPNATGETRDLGVRFYLLGGRLSISASQFQNSARDQARGASTYISNSRAILSRLRSNYKDKGDSHFAAMAQVGGYMVDTGEVSDTWSFDAKGHELSVVFNPSPSWRVSLSGSANRNIMGEHLASLGRYLNTAAPFQGLETWRNYVTELRKVEAGQRSNAFDLDPNNPAARTQAGDDARYIESQTNSAERQYLDERAIEGLTQNRNGEYAFNGVAAHNFPATSRLKGWTVGGNFRWRSANIIGYERNLTAAGVPAGTIIVDRPLRGSAFWEAGAMLSHQRRMFGRTNVRLQINVDNLFDFTKPRLVSMDYDSEAIYGTANALVPIRWEMRRPRNFVFSATFDL